MQLIRGIHNIHINHYGCVLTIGNFDGVHRGHQVVLKKLKQEGERLGLPVIVMIFEPQPLEMFIADSAPVRLTRLRDKVKYISQAGIDYLLCVKFNLNFATNSAQMFINQLLIKKLGVQSLIVGDDFHFGIGRKGDAMLLHQAGKQYGFKVINTSSFCADGQRISSTAIRDALNGDSLSLAENFLGHPYSISGRVVQGNKLGRTIGFPTANLHIKRQRVPVKGVYIVEVHGLKPNAIPGIANIGTRPTFSGIYQQLEVHLLDITMDMYKRHLDVILRMKLRNEERFASIDALKQQITNDVAMARKFFRLEIQH